MANKSEQSLARPIMQIELCDSSEDKAEDPNRTVSERQAQNGSFNKNVLELYTHTNGSSSPRTPQAKVEKQIKKFTSQLDKIDKKSQEAGDIFNQIGIIQLEYGLLNSAIDSFLHGLEIYKRVLGFKSKKTAQVLNNLGTAFKKKNNMKLAEKNFLKAEEIKLILYGPDDLELVGTYTNLGNFYNEQNEIKKAREYLNRAMTIIKENKNCEKTIDLAPIYNNFGAIARKEGRYQESIDYYKQSIEIKEKSIGSNSRRLIESYLGLATTYKIIGKYSEALDTAEKAMKVSLNKLGENHIVVAKCHEILGSIYENEGNFTLAIEHFEKALHLKRNEFGEDDISLANIHNYLGILYEKESKNEEASTHIKKSLQIFQKIYPEDHPIIIKIKLNHVSLENLYRPAKVIKELEEILADIIEKNGEENIEVANLKNNMGLCYQILGNISAAKKALLSALSIKEKLFGKQHPDIAAILNNIGLLYEGEKNYSTALEYFSKAQAILSTSLVSENNLKLASLSQNIGTIHKKMMNFEEAQRHYTQALGIFRESRGEDHPDFEYVRKNMISCSPRRGGRRTAMINYLDPKFLKTLKTLKTLKSLKTLNNNPNTISAPRSQLNAFSDSAQPSRARTFKVKNVANSEQPSTIIPEFETPKH